MKQVWAKITCLNCKNEMIQVVDTYINPNVEKDLKQKILNDQLFDQICPKCHHRVKTVYPCIYKDTKKKLMIYLKQVLPIEAEGLRQRRVDNMEDFKELILIHDAGVDERAVLLMKKQLRAYCEKKQPVKQIHFYDAEEEYVFFDVDGELKAMKKMKLNLPQEDFNEILDWSKAGRKL